MLYTLDISSWHELINFDIQQQVLTALESGKVIFLPKLPFEIQNHELEFLSPKIASPNVKNISFNSSNQSLQGAICSKTQSLQLNRMLMRYASYSRLLLKNLLPHYSNHLASARTSYRPVEIAGRKAPSFRKDDTRLHVDAFPATPTQGKRILRVFTNVNPHKPRVWRLGAPFPEVVEYFYPKLKKPLLGSAILLHALRITKNKRSLYDHYMLQLHNAMKSDLVYQSQVPQIEFQFPSGSTWIVYTDQVSHAAMAGQFTLEQTFNLPNHALAYERESPLRVLEKFLDQALL